MRKMPWVFPVLLFFGTLSPCFGKEPVSKTSMPSGREDSIQEPEFSNNKRNDVKPRFEEDMGTIGLFAGAGVVERDAGTDGNMQFGADFRVNQSTDFPLGYLVEGGYKGPFKDFGSGKALISLNLMKSFVVGKAGRWQVFGTGGYTWLFGAHDAVNYGCGIEYLLSRKKVLRFEVRDYLKYDNFSQHDAAFRVGLGFGEPD
jgi:hypothetical protein